MPTPAIHPSFTPDDPAANALELCDLFQIRREEDVPIKSFRILFDGAERRVDVGPGQYKWALFMMHLMTVTGETDFEFIESLRQLSIDRFGPYLMHEVVQHRTKDATLHALLDRRVVCISIEPKSGYQSHLVSFRTYPEVFAWAWERRDTITPTSPEPFLRCALTSFFEDLEAKNLEMSDEPGHWPTYEWGDRALELQRRLTPS